MKRGLKEACGAKFLFFSSCYNHCPDEKGTESFANDHSHGHGASYNHCPDEKGTERLSAFTDQELITELQPLPR